ncbi:MAG: hypothetical protein JWR68_140 [Polaromonas sp.]|nr:hypothetical protein [Polaromonas sp.]
MENPEELTEGLRLNITLIYSPAPREVREWTVMLAPGATVMQAIARCGILDDFQNLRQDQLELGIWGRKTGLQCQLHDRDRIEIYRELRVDPKTARRQRFDKQGTKSAGLFVRSRPGAKAGY